MKNKILYTALAYWFLVLGLVLILSGCKTKKSTTDFKKTETENVSIVDNSTVAKTETVTETTNLSESAKWSDKSFFEAWMSFESDKITITDNQGNKTEITNPRINKKSSQRKDVNQSNQIVIKKEKATEINENKQNNVAVSNNRQIKTDLQKSSSSKGKEPIWLYVVGVVLVGGFGYFILKRFSLI